MDDEMGEMPSDHLIEGAGDKYALRAARSWDEEPVVPNPTNTVLAPCAETRVSPPKYEEAGEEVETAGATSLLYRLTSSASREESIPVPSTATSLKAVLAKADTSATVIPLWAGAKSDAPRPLRKARACASSMAVVAGSCAAWVDSPSTTGATYSSSS